MAEKFDECNRRRINGKKDTFHIGRLLFYLQWQYGFCNTGYVPILAARISFIKRMIREPGPEQPEKADKRL